MSGTGHRRTLAVLLAVVFLLISCSGDTAVMPTTTTAAVMSTTTMTVPATVTDKSSEELVGMYEWDPENGFHDEVWSGTLVIDGPCVYIDATEHDGAAPTSQSVDSLRAFIKLPESLTRYNADTGELWVIGAGPMSTGDHIVLTGRSILEFHWKYHGDSGLYNFWYDDERTRACPANLAFWTASMRPSNANP